MAGGVIRALCRSTHTAQGFDALINALRPQPADAKEWGGMAMFLKNQVRHDDPRMATVYANLQADEDYRLPGRCRANSNYGHSDRSWTAAVLCRFGVHRPRQLRNATFAK